MPLTQPRFFKALRRVAGLLAFFAVGLYLALGVTLYVVQRDLFYPRHELPQTSPPTGRADVRRLEHESSGGVALAYLLTAPAAAAPAPLMVYFHGNGALAQWVWPGMTPYRDMGMHVLVVEYPGYGGAAGEPTQESLTAASTAWVERVLEREDVDAQRVVYFGSSLGGGVAAQVARALPPRAFILRSTFSSMRELAHTMWMPGSLVRDPYDSHAVLAGLPHVPVLLSHGRHDRLIPMWHAEKLSGVHSGVRFAQYSCGHNGCPVEDAQIIRERQAFLCEVKILACEP